MATKPPLRDYISQAGSLRVSTSQTKWRPSRPRMQQLVKPKLKSANLITKQRLKFAITRQLSQLLKQALPWPVRNLAYLLYQSHKSQGEENQQAKAQAISQVEAQLSQLESSLATSPCSVCRFGCPTSLRVRLKQSIRVPQIPTFVKVGRGIDPF